ncbi:MAG: EamA family transporter [Clostridiales bacterium]|nr:EamA family transporter [Clostridiales bacterium]
MWVVMALLSALFAGLTAILSKMSVRSMDSTVATAIRTTVVLAFAWLLAWMEGLCPRLSGLPARAYVFLALSGFCTGGSWLCYFHALKLGPVSRVAAVDKSSTVLTMLLAWALLGEHLTWLKGLCILLIGLGTLMMLQPAQGEAHRPSGSAGWLAYAALSALFAAMTAILAKIGIENVPSDLATALRTTVVLIMAWGMVAIGGKREQLKKVDRGDLRFLLLSGVATGMSWLCYYRALQEGPASVVVPLDKLSIVITVAFSRIALKERLGRRALAGLLLLVAGTGLLLA